MVQYNKVCSELGILADHVESEKGRGTDGMKKMKRSNSIKLSDLEAIQSSLPRRSLSQSRKLLPLHVPTTAAAPQKHKPLMRKSVNYMKPTSSSDAKKVLLPVTLQNNQCGSDGKNLPQKYSSSSKSSFVSNKNTAKTMSRSSSMNLVRTSTQTLSFKPSTTCQRKSTAATLPADINATYRATCSSTLKDSKFPAHLMLNTGGSDSEGASVIKVCPYTYCSLNGNRHAPGKRRFLETRKSIKLEAPERLKVPCEKRKNFDIEQTVYYGKHACDEADKGKPIIIPLIQEIGIDFFNELYGEEREKAYKVEKPDTVKHLEDQEGTKFAKAVNDNIADKEDVGQVTPCLSCDDLTKSEINPKVEFKIEANTKESFHHELNSEDADKNHPPSCFHEEICTGSYCHEVSDDDEHVENIELDDSDTQSADMEWEEKQFCPINYKEDIGSSVITHETDSKFKSLSEGSHDIFEMWLGDISSNHYANIMVEKELQDKEEKITIFYAQHHDTNCVQGSTGESIQTDYLSKGIDHEYGQSYLVQYLRNTEGNDREIEKHVDNEVICASVVLDEDTIDTSEVHNICETRKIEESREDSNTDLENNDKEICQRNQIPLSNVPEESNIIVQDQEFLEEAQVTSTEFQIITCIGGEGRSMSNNRQRPAKNKRPMKDAEQMRTINPRKPNFLPFVPDPEPEKVELKHQMMDNRKNAEEWMLDFSLRQAVTKLAPARKKKVALLVEAFETIMSTPECETHTRNNSPFTHARPIQACS
ncbi:hypothetical protein TSUD_90140 [Trifolium subterraneum]|uniref:Calmodulin-binding domain-containing protein n=1 Tax=Trifolium subterraneum TaxID=3900 RepID=A0A2Z6PM02_TRISU|nr:hypothetical protein TSUD_90140 [Trifolium subterraneum]